MLIIVLDIPEKMAGQKLTNAQKCKRRREKKIAEDCSAYREKEKARVKKYRSKMTSAEQDLARKKNREQKKEARLRKKIEKEQTVKEYKTNAALGKAKAKVDRALPENPLRAKVVLEASLSTINKQIGHVDTEMISPPNTKHLGLSENVVNSVTSFYYRQDISIEFPGHKDYVRVKQQDGSFKKMTKHILAMTVRECFALFVSEFPDKEINISKFYSLRPPNVLLRHKMPHNVCTCIYHENINYLIAGINKHSQDFPKNHAELVKATSCSEVNIFSEECQSLQCEDCKSLNTWENFLNLVDSDPTLLQSWYIKYFRWEKQDTDGTERLRKVEKYDSLKYVLELLIQDWPFFKNHRLIKVKQDERFNELYSRRDSTSLLLQFDFSENAEIVEQDEVQSAHWWHLQVSIFTACAWIDQEKNCFGIVTDYMSHDKYLSTLCVTKVLRLLIEKYPDVKNINLFSDGAAQHFKQCYFLTAMTELNALLGLPNNHLEISYDLFATSHGKGAVDGIGGTLKRQVRNEIMCRREKVACAEEYAKVAEKVCPNVNVLHVSKEEVLNSKPLFDEIFDGCRTLPGTRKTHHFDVSGQFTVTYKVNAYSDQEKTFVFK